MFKSRNPQVLGLFGHGIIRQGKTVTSIAVSRLYIERFRKVLDSAVMVTDAQGIVTATNIIFDAGNQQNSD